jgi:predicted nucleic acid-binding protein
MPRVVADANVLVSAALARSPQAPSVLTLDAALDGRVELVTSPLLLREVTIVLARPRLQKYVSADEAARFVADLAAQTILLVDPPRPHRACAVIPATTISSRSLRPVELRRSSAGTSTCLPLIQLGSPSRSSRPGSSPTGWASQQHCTGVRYGIHRVSADARPGMSAVWTPANPPAEARITCIQANSNRSPRFSIWSPDLERSFWGPKRDKISVESA